MPLSSKFFIETTCEKIVKTDQYLAKIWTKCNSLLFWPTQYVITNQAYNKTNQHILTHTKQ